MASAEQTHLMNGGAIGSGMRLLGGQHLQPLSRTASTLPCLATALSWLLTRCVFHCHVAKLSGLQQAVPKWVEQSLTSGGIKPMSSLHGLKKTLNGHTIRTSSFGRTILMAGLLSVSWHMNQWDLQVSSLGVTIALGRRDTRQRSLTRAFDFWKQDFDSSLNRPVELYSG